MDENYLHFMAENEVPAVYFLNPDAPAIMQLELPGHVLTYELSQDETVVEPFEAITFFAVEESGLYGPMSTEDLKSFLWENLDKRRVKILDLIGRYPSVPGSPNYVVAFLDQLMRLRQRVQQIDTKEKELTKFLIKRINALRTDLLREKPISNSFVREFPNVAKKALEKVVHEGSPSKEELEDFIITGRYGCARMQLLEMLEKYKNAIYNQVSNDKIHFVPVNEKILKAIEDIENALIEN